MEDVQSNRTSKELTHERNPTGIRYRYRVSISCPDERPSTGEVGTWRGRSPRSAAFTNPRPPALCWRSPFLSSRLAHCAVRRHRRLVHGWPSAPGGQCRFGVPLESLSEKGHVLLRYGALR